jgi:hypothetical protein
MSPQLRLIAASATLSLMGATAAIAGDDTVNGCAAADAIDLTAASASVVVSFTFEVAAPKTRLDPTRICLKIRSDQKITMQGTGIVGGPMILGGTVDGTGLAIYDKSSPIQPSCFNGNSPPNPNQKTCYSGGVWPCASTSCKAFGPGVYGFYNSSNRSQKGALYVVP